LEDILARASMPDKTVILTTLNAAWAQPNTMIDLFLDSFHQGEGIEYLLNHLVIIALDQVAYNRCTELHTACFMLTTEGVDFAAEKFFMTGEYLMMMWRRIEFLRKVLEMGYSFVFSVSCISRSSNNCFVSMLLHKMLPAISILCLPYGG
jgi:hypothetical protein